MQVYINKDEYKKIHFEFGQPFSVTTNDGKIGYYYSNEDEKAMAEEEAQYLAIGVKPLNAGNVGPINTANADFKPLRYNQAPYSGGWGDGPTGDYYMRAREKDLTFDIEDTSA